MDNSKSEVKGINKNHLLKNQIKCNEIKRKLSDIYFYDEDPKNKLSSDSKIDINDKENKYERVKENNTFDNLLCEKKKFLETEKDLLKNKDIHEEMYINESCTNHSSRKKRKKKKKKSNNNTEIIKPTNQMIRINYLLQASFLMNKFNPNISREYIKTMRRFSNKFLIKYDKKFKKLFCKKCNSVLIPSVTCKVSVDPLNLQKKKIDKNEHIKDSIKKNNYFNIKSKDEYLVSYKCNYCQHNTKFVYDNNLITPQEKENFEENVHTI
ncbi:ribonuclease P protein subunit RPR2, putative [Plasmodium gallinaceum]|uniref:Ribonuclease P protein subunit RPR2, putative n=1 Tax=Plasmodium gallinaceum TaxID=5849 RepID=A0A1J1GRA7_PLAGA|nr:ribonuclease P protein subunit RPR2, putative [Plasmodium gallinaceum]CRG94997.1 ribonuclease P protein subunit RPR2, putative [Plasmodium gallinaceum]